MGHSNPQKGQVLWSQRGIQTLEWHLGPGGEAGLWAKTGSAGRLARERPLSSQSKAGAAEGEAGGRKAAKQEPGREREKGPDPVAQACGEGRKAEKWGGHMKSFTGI